MALNPVAHYASKETIKQNKCSFLERVLNYKQSTHSTTKSMKKIFKRIAYPLLVLVIAASCSSPRYASAQNDGYYDNNGSNNDNRSYNDPNYNDQNDQNYDQ